MKSDRLGNKLHAGSDQEFDMASSAISSVGRSVIVKVYFVLGGAMSLLSPLYN